MATTYPGGYAYDTVGKYYTNPYGFGNSGLQQMTNDSYARTSTLNSYTNGNTNSSGSSGSSNSQSVYQKQIWNWLQDAITQMTGAQEQANTEMKDRQVASEDLFSGILNQYQSDPTYQTLQDSWADWMANPGISDATRKRLEAQTLARASADAGAGMNAARSAAATQGISGAAAAALQGQARSAGAANANNALTNLAYQIEEQRLGDRQNAMNYGQSLYQNYYSGLGNLGSQYTNILAQWQPQAADFDPYSLALAAYGLL